MLDQSDIEWWMYVDAAQPNVLSVQNEPTSYLPLPCDNELGIQKYR